MTMRQDADALRIFVPVAIRAIFMRLSPRLEAAAGRALAPVFDLNPAIPERILAGEAYDIGLTNPPYVDALVAAGRADGASQRPFGRIPLATGRRAGMEAPVLTDAAGVAALLRGAESIAYTGEGTSGRTYLDAMARLGLAEAVAPKSRPMGAGGPVAAVAAGETELAVGPLTVIEIDPRGAVTQFALAAPYFNDSIDPATLPEGITSLAGPLLRAPTKSGATQP
jgi:hypothetical protein